MIIEFLYIALGGLISWFITHLYYRHSSKKTPEWARSFVQNIPQEPPATKQELKKILNEFLNYFEPDLISSDSNSDGEWFRYKNGNQLCKSSFTIKNNFTDAQKITIPYPTKFASNPSVEVSGPISYLISKTTTKDSFTLEIKSPPSDKKLTFEYQARGFWI